MIGKVVGPYRVAAKLGEGGMGSVYRAVDQMLQRDVAIKVLRPELAKQKTLVERFRTEAVALARLSHPNIATVHGLLDHRDSLLMVMEFVDGDTLETLLARDGRLSSEYAVAVCRDVLAALHHAHSMGVIHRDLKPANLMIARTGVVKVMDFGIARMAGTNRHTEFGRVIGTPLYMSPEQLRGEEVDGRSDVYSLAIVLYELLTGCEAFRADSDYAILMAQLSQMPEPPSRLVKTLPAGLDDVLMRSLQKARADRYQSAAQFREALTPFAMRRTRTSLGGVPRVTPPDAPAPPLPGDASLGASPAVPPTSDPSPPPSDPSPPTPPATAAPEIPPPDTVEHPAAAPVASAPTLPEAHLAGAGPAPETRLADPAPAPETRLADPVSTPETRLADSGPAVAPRAADPVRGWAHAGPVGSAPPGEPVAAARARSGGLIGSPAARYGAVAVIAAVLLGGLVMSQERDIRPAADTVAVAPPGPDTLATPVPAPVPPPVVAVRGPAVTPTREPDIELVDPAPRPRPSPPPSPAPSPAPTPPPPPPPPAPAPAPAPPPPPPAPDPDPAVPAFTPATFAGGIDPVVRALEQRRASELEALYLRATDQDRRNWDLLAELLKKFSVEVADLAVATAAPAERGRAAVQYTAQLRWRSSFGNTRREAVRIAAVFEWQGDRWRLRGWRFAGTPDLD